MKERIEAIIRHERLTPSQFADAIGVQRSGISHILSGRNKPSLDFLDKLLARFPHISGDWLITGQGSLLKSSQRGVSEETQISMQLTEELPKKSFKVPKKEVQKEEAPSEPSLQAPKSTASEVIPGIGAQEGKRIERVIVFYTDKSFSEYRPE
ncbi:helix-turn-helix domain-containing protein [Carboxylicivirga taeanensis]|uniref:helix-turn-helix domain-containing protein n=1 Tax=Carboxylicivirga taeanensis TaxID=1416875 RepID=UPI003F6DD9C0